MSISKEDREELQVARSSRLRQDLDRLAASRLRCFFAGAAADADKALAFLCEYNAFINHAPKRFRPILDARMKL